MNRLICAPLLPLYPHTDMVAHVNTPTRQTRMHGHAARPRPSAAARGPHCHIHLPLFRHHAGGLKQTTPLSYPLPTQITQTPAEIHSTHTQI